MQYERIGVYPPKGLGRCGLCGQQRTMTEAHVPPQAVGNRGPERERAVWVSGSGGAQIGRWQQGGLSVYGLCRDCNLATSSHADLAYRDFHRDVERMTSPTFAQLLISHDVPPARVAPGLVARSVLAGMFAINGLLYDRFPDFAAGLAGTDDDLRLPDELRLRVALSVGPRSRIGGPIGYMRVLTVRQFYMPMADIWFPPLVWCLDSTRGAVDETSLGVPLTSHWGDATAWIRYRRDLECDLRNVLRVIPIVVMPEFGHDDWVILAGKSMTAMEGRATTPS